MEVMATVAKVAQSWLTASRLLALAEGVSLDAVKHPEYTEHSEYAGWKPGTQGANALHPH